MRRIYKAVTTASGSKVFVNSSTQEMLEERGFKYMDLTGAKRIVMEGDRLVQVFGYTPERGLFADVY